MHNHVLTFDPRILPDLRKNAKRPIFKTPSIDNLLEIYANCEEEFVNKVIQLSRERGFDV
jgi:hypothetical protein